MVSWRSETNQVNLDYQRLIDRNTVVVFDTLVRNIKVMIRQNQREVIGVNPDNAELWVVGVVSGHVFQDLQEFITIWGG